MNYEADRCSKVPVRETLVVAHEVLHSLLITVIPSYFYQGDPETVSRVEEIFVVLIVNFRPRKSLPPD